jgi:hypothetical protein
MDRRRNDPTSDFRMRVRKMDARALRHGRIVESDGEKRGRKDRLNKLRRQDVPSQRGATIWVATNSLEAADIRVDIVTAVAGQLFHEIQHINSRHVLHGPRNRA